MLTRLLSVRIVRWTHKLLYVVGVWLIGSVLVRLLALTPIWSPLLVVMSFVLDIASVLVGARIFRGKYEPREPARAWWRMTAWRPLSLRLGILFSILAALSAIYGVLLAFGIETSSTTMLPWYATVLSTLLYSILGFLYLNSAIRLKRAGIERPEPEPKFASTAKFD